MHMPFCTVADKCLRCDHVRAGREIKRLREVLRTTMDELIASRDEVKDLNAKLAKLDITIRELEISIRLAQAGKLSTSKIFPPSYKALSDPAVDKGLFM